MLYYIQSFNFQVVNITLKYNLINSIFAGDVSIFSVPAKINVGGQRRRRGESEKENR